MSKYKDLKGVESKIISCENKHSFTNDHIISVNSKFLAIPYLNKKEILIVDSYIPLSSDSNKLILNSNHGDFLYLTFSPFVRNLLASSHEDSNVLLWNIPKDTKLKGYLNNCQIYKKHSNKVAIMSFNPVVSNLICSTTVKGELHIWDILKNDTYFTINSLKNPSSLEWNENGSLIGISDNNKINIFDPRIEQKVVVFEINEKIQKLKFTWIGKELFATTELDQSRNQKLKLWDIRNNKICYESFKEKDKIEITPFCDKESQLIYTIGQKDIKTNVYDYSTGRITKISDFISSEPSLCSVLFERKCLDYNKNEIDRFARFTSNNNIYYVNFIIQNKNGFDKNLYPPIEYGESAIKSELWIKGENAEPIPTEIYYSEFAMGEARIKIYHSHK